MAAFAPKGSLVFLCINEHAIDAVNTDGSGYRRLLTRECVCPDGLALDFSTYCHTGKLEDINMLWTNMGERKPNPAARDGGDWHAPDGFLAAASLLGGDASAKRLPLRAPAHLVDAHGTAVKPRFPADGIFFTTLKQLVLSGDNRSLFFCDREGHCVKKYNRDTHEVVPLLFSDDIPQLRHEAGKPYAPGDDEQHFCVGVMPDEANNHIFFTVKGPTHGGCGRIFAAPYDFSTRNVPASANAPDGAEGVIDPESAVILADNLPEPIDLLLDSRGGFLYWTDRGDASAGGCSLNRATLTYTNGHPQLGKTEVLITGFEDAIGVTWAAAQDPHSEEARRYLYVTDTGGHVYRCDMQTLTKECIHKGAGGITGIDYVPQTLPV